MQRSILAMASGWVAAILVIVAFESVYQQIFPFPPGTNPYNPLSVAAGISNGPTYILFRILVGWALGASLGGLAASHVSGLPESRSSLGTFLALFLQLGALMNNLSASPPAWFWVISMLEFLPFCLAGARRSEKEFISAFSGLTVALVLVALLF